MRLSWWQQADHVGKLEKQYGLRCNSSTDKGPLVVCMLADKVRHALGRPMGEGMEEPLHDSGMRACM